jgi:hypothetical protein
MATLQLYAMTVTVEHVCPCGWCDVVPAGTVLHACPGGCPIEFHEVICPICGRTVGGGTDAPLPLVPLVSLHGDPVTITDPEE